MKQNFVKRTVKRMAAVGTGVAMLGATLTGAMAADLADYPAPFVNDGVYDDSNAFVVGDNALAADTLGAVDIASNLQYESGTSSASGSSSVTVLGGSSEQIALGKGISNTTYFDTTLEDDDVDSFFDGVITFQGTEYDTSERLELETLTDPVVQTSLSASEDDYVEGVYLEVTSRDVIRFAYRFDESINLSKVTSAQPLEIDFMGHSLKVTSIDSATKFTAYVGQEVYLSVDGSSTVTINGVDKTVTLTDVSSTSAVVDVDGVSKIIAKAATQTVNGVEITVDDVFSRTERSESSANLVVGEQASETYQDGDPFIGENTDDPNWVWDIAGLTTTGTAQTFRIENDFVYNDLSDDGPGVGDCISLPNDYAQICLDSLTVDDDSYATYTMEFDSSTDLSDALAGNTSVATLYLTSSVDEGFQMLAYTSANATAISNVTSTIRAKEVWLFTQDEANLTVTGLKQPNNTAFSPATNYSSTTKWLGVFYKDTSNSKVKLFGQINVNGTSTEILRLNYGNSKDTNIVLKGSAENVLSASQAINFTWVVQADSTNDLQAAADDFDIEWGLSAVEGFVDSLGATRSSEEAQEIKWGTGNLALGTKDENHRTFYGIILDNPKGNGASDQVVIKVPQDQVFANVLVKGTSTTTSSAAGGDSWSATAVTPMTKLASEVSDASSYNLILLGGPCANDLVEELFGHTCDGWAYANGEAILELADNGDKVALLVAGTSADDTRRAAKALAAYDEYDMSGSSAMVTGSSLTDISVA
jgi:hypothetical protein